MKRIELKQISVSEKEVLIKDRGHEIIFHENYLELNSSGDWKFYNEDLAMMEDKHFENHKCIQKENIGEIDLFYHTLSENFVIEFPYYKIVFKEFNEAKELYDKIKDWKFKNIIPA